MMYLLDANIFIESHKTHYNLKVFPCFWNKIVELAEHGVVFTLDKVQNELMVGDDVSEWFKTNFPAKNILPTDDTTYANYQNVLNDVVARNCYNGPALSAFSNPNIADPFLCAYAMSHFDFSVVTYEKSNQFGKKGVKLPDICQMEGVTCIPVIPMLLNLGIEFK